MSDLKDNRESKETGAKPSSVNELNEIDDFTQKLLDKQTEYLLFPDLDEEDVTTSSLEGSMSLDQRKKAEETMLNALDQMRRERGQMPISEEEKQYSVRSASTRSASKKGVSSRMHWNKVDRKEKDTSVAPGRYEISEEPASVRSAAPVHDDRPFYKKTNFKIALVLILIAGVLFGAYAWKVTVYDPAHIASTTQEDSYKRLVNYADEFSMMSDAQKRNLVNLEADYNSLPQAKKTEINEYFKNPKHTGKEFMELLAEMKQNTLVTDNPAFNDLLSFAQGFNSASEDVRKEILTRIDAYNALDEEARKQVDEAMQQTTGKTFVQVYEEYKNAEQNDQSGDPNADSNTAPIDDPQNAALQAELDQLIADRDVYAGFLAEEGLESDEVLAQYDAQIAAIQAQLGQ